MHKNMRLQVARFLKLLSLPLQRAQFSAQEPTALRPHTQPGHSRLPQSGWRSPQRGQTPAKLPQRPEPAPLPRAQEVPVYRAGAQFAQTIFITHFCLHTPCRHAIPRVLHCPGTHTHCSRPETQQSKLSALGAEIATPSCFSPSPEISQIHLWQSQHSTTCLE